VRSGVVSVVIWFAIACLITAAVACQPSWPWSPSPAANIRHWPDSGEVYPEFYANLTTLLTTSAVFFLLLPLANGPLPRRLLCQAFPHRETAPTALQRAAYGLMWVALVVFAICYFVPGTSGALAWDAQPAGAIFWTSNSGNAALAAWLLTVVCGWLAAILASAGQVGLLLGHSEGERPARMPVAALGVLIAAVLQLVIYPCLAAFACAALLDLLSGNAVFLPAGMLMSDGHASTGGGPSLLWQHLLTILAWPTVLLCCVPLAGVVAARLARKSAAPKEDAVQAVAGSTESTAQSDATNESGAARPSPAAWALMLAAALFLTTIVVLACGVRFRSPATIPPIRAIGLDPRDAMIHTSLMVISAVCLFVAAWKARELGGRLKNMLIVIAVVFALLCGAGVTARVWAMAHRGLPPWQVQARVYPVADLQYVSAVRLRVLKIRDALETRQADKGVLSADDEALLDVCNRLHDQLIAPTEKAALDRDDPDVLAGVARVVAATDGLQVGDLALDGDAKQLDKLIGDMRERSHELQLPTVVPGGRARLGVSYLLTFTLLGYLLLLLSAAVAILLTVPRPSRLAALRGLAISWGLGTVFALCWFALA